MIRPLNYLRAAKLSCIIFYEVPDLARSLARDARTGFIPRATRNDWRTKEGVLLRTAYPPVPGEGTRDRYHTGRLVSDLDRTEVYRTRTLAPGGPGARYTPHRTEACRPRSVFDLRSRSHSSGSLSGIKLVL